ncbi:alpha/beta fold hydrolase [Luteimonas sp. 8-5]|uniref:alpha/beta hydrolase family protein n=1 Tax=Luteimonas sp. 8-5 TaxID=3039387 RepID=UPI002436332B|nr:alpha/beta fold hydrolase [Luteimonas sp. 8-5]MDG6348883.1 alpha/beta fold hydrolase [Luteimonas sp. 8-5]
MQTMNSVRAMLCALAVPALLLAFSAAAQAVDRVPVEAFVAKQTFENPRLSTAGTYVAVSADLGDDEHGIMVFRLADMSQTAFLKLPKYEMAIEIHWVSDTQLVYVKGGKWGAREEPWDFGEIIAMDYDGGRHRYIYGWKDTTEGMGLLKGHGNYAGRPVKPNDTFYMTRSSDESAIGRSLLYSIDLKAGRQQTGRHELVADVGPGQNLSFVLDDSGVPRFAFGWDKEENQLLFVAEDADGKNWRKVGVEGLFVPFAFTPDGTHVFGWFSKDGGPAALVKADLTLANREVLASDEFNSIGALTWDSKRQPLAVEYKGALPKLQFLDESSPDARLLKEIRAGFPGQHVRFLDHSADGNVSLLFIYSDRNPGEWAVFNRKTNSLARLLQVNPEIDPARMGSRHYVRFPASDGVELDAYVTVPAGVTELKSLPMVLLPHGGPHGVSDTWSYDSDAQFLASRGYLVLQVNYRGSGARGHSFQESGYRKWSTRIQEDLADGMKWAVSKGYADPARICVYGASFGGYSAMVLAARHPEMVKCVATLAGLYDLRSMNSTSSDTGRSFWARAYVDRAVGTDNNQMLADSPLSMAASIKAPVFMAHGEEDERTTFRQAEAMKKALDKAGNRPVWMPVRKEAHGFYKEENQVAFYQKLESFLAENIGAGN